MRETEGDSDRRPLRSGFDLRLKLELHGCRVTSDTALLAYRELDDSLGLTALASVVLSDSRTGKNGWHGVVGLLRHSVYVRLAGYEDVNDADLQQQADCLSCAIATRFSLRGSVPRGESRLKEKTTWSKSKHSAISIPRQIRSGILSQDLTRCRTTMARLQKVNSRRVVRNVTSR